MNFPCEDIFGMFKRMLDLHIATKTMDAVFHKESQYFYENMFDVYHDVMEVMQDLGKADGIPCESAKKEALDILMKTKSMLEDMIAGNDDVAIDSVLRRLHESIVSQSGIAQSLLNGKQMKKDKTAYDKEEETIIPDEDEYEEEEEDKEPTTDTDDEDMESSEDKEDEDEDEEDMSLLGK